MKLCAPQQIDERIALMRRSKSEYFRDDTQNLRDDTDVDPPARPLAQLAAMQNDFAESYADEQREAAAGADRAACHTARTTASSRDRSSGGPNTFEARVREMLKTVTIKDHGWTVGKLSRTFQEFTGCEEEYKWWIAEGFGTAKEAFLHIPELLTKKEKGSWFTKTKKGASTARVGEKKVLTKVAVRMRETPLTSLPAATPAALRALFAECLQDLARDQKAAVEAAAKKASADAEAIAIAAAKVEVATAEAKKAAREAAVVIAAARRQSAGDASIAAAKVEAAKSEAQVARLAVAKAERKVAVTAAAAVAEVKKRKMAEAETAATKQRMDHEVLCRAAAEAETMSACHTAQRHYVAKAKAETAATKVLHAKVEAAGSEVQAARLATAQAERKVAEAKAETAATKASFCSQWEWQENNSSWLPYSPADSNALSDAFRLFQYQGGTSVCSLSPRYSIDFATLQQTRIETGNRRLVRRQQSQFEAASVAGAPKGGASSVLAWAPTTKVTQLGGGATKRSLTSASASSYARESLEWNMAVGQFTRLSGGAATTVIGVDVYACPAVTTAYEAQKAAFATSGTPTGEIWIFHGTSPANVQAIMTGGFKVGGRDLGVPVANGTAHGAGVYSAKGPGTPMGYTKGGKEIILARAMQGKIGARERSDCWEPCRDWAIFRDGKQLLPTYVVHFR